MVTTTVTTCRGTCVDVEGAVMTIHSQYIVTNPWVVEASPAELVEVSSTVLHTRLSVLLLHVHLNRKTMSTVC